MFKLNFGRPTLTPQTHSIHTDSAPRSMTDLFKAISFFILKDKYKSKQIMAMNDIDNVVFILLQNGDLKQKYSLWIQ